MVVSLLSKSLHRFEFCFIVLADRNIFMTKPDSHMGMNGQCVNWEDSLDE